MFPYLCYVLGSFPTIAIGIARVLIGTLHLSSNIDDDNIYVYGRLCAHWLFCRCLPWVFKDQDFDAIVVKANHGLLELHRHCK